MRNKRRSLPLFAALLCFEEGLGPWCSEGALWLLGGTPADAGVQKACLCPAGSRLTTERFSAPMRLGDEPSWHSL